MPLSSLIRIAPKNFISLGSRFIRNSSSEPYKKQVYDLVKLDNTIDKWVVRGFGKYPKNNLPELISFTELSNLKSRARIWLSNLGIILTFVACGVIIYNGKQDANRRRNEYFKRQEERNVQEGFTNEKKE